MISSILYLHGFASGPESTKGLFFRKQFAALGIPVDLPDLNGGSFESLTITGQLEIIESCVAGSLPSAIIGSSLGGYLAALYAARHPKQVQSLVLLAPGFGFGRRWPEWLGQQTVQRWKAEGWMEMYHYGLKRHVRLGYQLLEDSQRYEDYPDVRDPTLIFHGTRDVVVSPRYSEEFAKGRPNVRLEFLDSDHELVDMLDTMWPEILEFLNRR